MCFGLHGSIKPWVPSPPPGKPHLALDINTQGRPVQFLQAGKRREHCGPFEEPAKAVGGKCRTAFRAGELPGSNLVAARLFKDGPQAHFRDAGQEHVCHVAHLICCCDRTGRLRITRPAPGSWRPAKTVLRRAWGPDDGDADAAGRCGARLWPVSDDIPCDFTRASRIAGRVTPCFPGVRGRSVC